MPIPASLRARPQLPRQGDAANLGWTALTLVDYTGGRSEGRTSWSPSDARQIIAMVKDDPTTLYQGAT
jgi:hypothetical protein